MRKVLKWGVVPLNLYDMACTPHSLCWARINSPELVSHCNSVATVSIPMSMYITHTQIMELFLLVVLVVGGCTP